MKAESFRYGFRAFGREDERRLTDWNKAFRAHVEADPRAATDGECYLSQFQFADEFRTHLELTGSTKRYNGPTWAGFVGFDIDRKDNLELALTDARRLAASLEMQLGIDVDSILPFFSGSKGFHILIPTWLFNPEPSGDFHKAVRAFCCLLAAKSGIDIDTGVYAQVNLFRAPNSRHRETGLFKIPLTPADLFEVKLEVIQRMASEPREGWIPREGDQSAAAVEVWKQATHEVAETSAATAERKSNGRKTKLNPTTRAFLRGELPTEGDRARLLFSAAADMAEFESMDSLIHAVLVEAGLNCGLSASEVSRQISCGINRGGLLNV